MCGIFGISSTKSLLLREKDFIKQSTFVGTLRGDDSTGLAIVDKNNNVETYKRALSGPDFSVSSTGRAAFASLDDAFVVLGHNRAATRGKVSDGTAHPFGFNRIVGCHNGTLRTNVGLTVKDMPVDSMNLLATLNALDSGDLAAHTEVLAAIQGSYALTWYEYETEDLFFVRNDQRPLYYWSNKSKEPLFWASEKEMLHWVLSRCRYSHSIGEITELPEHTLCVYNTREGELKDTVKFTPKAPSYSGGYNSGGWPGTYSTNKKEKDEGPVPKERVRNDETFGVKAVTCGIKEAIKKGYWNADDEEVAVFFDTEHNVKKGSPVRQLEGYAITQTGEMFNVVAWASKKGAELDVPYVGNIIWIKYTDEYDIVLEVSVDSKRLKAMTKTKGKSYKQMIKELQEEVQLYHEPFRALIEREDARKGKSSDSKVTPIEGAKEKKSQSKQSSNKTHKCGDLINGPGGDLIPLEHFAALVQGGCITCGRAITPEDATTIAWLEQGEKSNPGPVCQSCLPEHMSEQGETFEALRMC